jgi:hypothetical protein
MTAYRQPIRVIYPQDGGRIALRTDENWNADVEAVSRNGCTTEFQVETERPYFYFKPVLRRDGTTMWSRGENCLAIATSGAPLEVHPFFREDTKCSVCELMPPLASPSGIEHRFRVFLPPGFHENTLKRYPVLYMHDGHNLFLKEEAFVGNTWRTDEVINMLDKMNAIEEVRCRNSSSRPDERVHHARIRGLRPVSCRNAQAIGRREVPHAIRADRHSGYGLITRRRCFLLPRMAVA